MTDAVISRILEDTDDSDVINVDKKSNDEKESDDEEDFLMREMDDGIVGRLASEDATLRRALAKMMIHRKKLIDQIGKEQEYQDAKLQELQALEDELKSLRGTIDKKLAMLQTVEATIRDVKKGYETLLFSAQCLNSCIETGGVSRNPAFQQPCFEALEHEIPAHKMNGLPPRRISTAEDLNCPVHHYPKPPSMNSSEK